MEGQRRLATHVPRLSEAFDKLRKASYSLLLKCLREGKRLGEEKAPPGFLASGKPSLRGSSFHTWLECEAASQSLLAESNKFFIFLTRTHASPFKLVAFLIKKCIPGYTREGATWINSPVR